MADDSFRIRTVICQLYQWAKDKIFRMKKKPYVLNFIICWLGWGIPMGLLCSILFTSLRKGLLLGILGGGFFAAVMILFTVILSSRKDQLRKRYGIEGTVLHDGAANRMVHKEAVGGWIFLMEDRFCFVSHALNTTVGEWTVPYTDITAVTQGKRMRSIAVHTKEGTAEEFVVNNRREWMKLICRSL